MAMNRETKRMLQRQGAIDAEGAPARQQRRQPAQTTKPKEQRQSPIKWARQFLREVVAEMKKVVWPTRNEVVNYSIVVFIMLVVLTAMIGLLDYGFGQAVLKVFS